MAKDLTARSKFLALILRHSPEKAKLELNKNGWAKVEDLINPMKGDFSLKELEEIIRTDNKGRYEFNLDKTLVRACQGHSMKSVELEMVKQKPPAYLYHGTKDQFMSPIQKQGLRKMGRHHVHLSKDSNVAKEVANRRKGKSVILKIDSEKMYNDGISFYKSSNGVWLVDAVPYKYIKSTTDI